MQSLENQLIARVLLSDDRVAFAALVRSYQSSLRGLLRRLVGGDAALADDLAQESFLRAWQGLRQFKGGSRFSTWLYSIAWNTFLSDARCARHRHDADRSMLLKGERQVDADRFDRAIARADIERALLTLRPEERAAIALTYGQELTHEEAAKILECPLGTLKTNVLRGKDQLRSHFMNEVGAAL